MGVMEGIVGLFPRKRGVNSPGEAGLSELFQSLLVSSLGVDYAELSWNGVLYTASSGLVATPAAGPLGAAGTPLLALWNPSGTDMIAIITRIFTGVTALGTTSGKGFELDAGKTADITQATTVAAKANAVGQADDGDMKAFSAVALTSSTALARLRWLAAHGNGTAAAFMGQPTAEDIRGAVILKPGTVAAITAAALGVANEAIASIEYAKVNVK
jgi:hypothetical protein